MEWLNKKRQEIDEIDNKIVNLICDRVSIIMEIGEYKNSNSIPVMQYTRVNEVMKKRAELARNRGIDEKLIHDIYQIIIDYSCVQEEKIVSLNQEKKQSKVIRIATLGPEGTCHDNAVKNYIKYQKLVDNNTSITYINNFEDAVVLLKNGDVDYIIQNCAHPQVGLLNEKYRNEIYMIDSFVFPTKSMGIIKKKNWKEGRNLGMMPATINYICKEEWNDLIYESSNPLVEQGLLEGKYGYGITFLEAVDRHPEELELVENFGGPIDTGWIVYGKKKRNIYGDVLGTNLHEYYVKEI